MAGFVDIIGAELDKAKDARASSFIGTEIQFVR